MINVFLLLLLLIVWIHLQQKISRSLAQTETLLKDMAALKELLSGRTAEEKQHACPVSPSDQIAEQGGALFRAERDLLSEPVSFPEPPLAGAEEHVWDVNGASPMIGQSPSPLAAACSVVPPPPIREARPESASALVVCGCEAVTSPATACPPPPPPPPPSVRPSAAPLRAVNYEKYIGENLFGKIGILILVVGMGLFVKYAIDNEWINETLRTILGFAVGGILLLLAFRLKNPYRMFSSLLAGGAFAIFYVTIAIAYHYYELFSQPAAFLLLVVVTLLMSGLAIVYNRRELAVIALTGGFIAPFLVSNGMGSYLVLFTYVLILDLGMFALSFYRKWGELPVICFFFTWTILGGYAVFADLDLYSRRQLLHLLLFAIGFYLIFLLPVVSIVRINRKKINQMLLGVLVLNPFVFLFFALWFLGEMGLEHNYRGGFTLFVALIDFALLGWVRRKGGNFSFLFNTLLGLGLAFVSVTIPIQGEGKVITLFWATEMAVVLWFYTRFRSAVYRGFAVLLPVLACFSYVLDVADVFIHPSRFSEDSLFLNGLFATGLYLGLAWAVSAWLLQRAALRNTLSLLASALIIYVAFILDFHRHIHPALLSHSYMQLFTGVVLLGLTMVWSRKRFPMPRYTAGYAAGLGFSLVCFLIHAYRVNHAQAAEGLDFIFEWISLLVVSVHAVWIGCLYYRGCDYRSPASRHMTLFLSLTGTVLLLIATNNLLHQLGLRDETNAGFSVALSVAGFIQMTVGMRLHLKLLRMVSLGVFGLVLLKLGVVDLWLLPTIGKVIVFILLGVILLVLSFLYQKLKSALFDDAPVSSGTEKEDGAEA